MSEQSARKGEAVSAELNFILLGAGLSRRFGSNKLLLDWQGKKLFQVSLDRLCSLCERLEQASEGKLLCRVIFVASGEELLEYGRSLPSVYTVENPNPERGQASSIRLGLECAEERRSGAEAVYDIFAVCDQPNMREETLYNYLTACLEKRPSLAAPAADNIWGNPCWFDAKFRPELLELKGDVGGKRVIRKHLEELFLYPVELEELLDVDTQEDWSSMV